MFAPDSLMTFFQVGHFERAPAGFTPANTTLVTMFFKLPRLPLLTNFDFNFTLLTMLFLEEILFNIDLFMDLFVMFFLNENPAHFHDGTSI